jgi:hypothetical protein
VLKAANRGSWRDGTVLSVVTFVVSVQFDDQATPGRLGTLWPDRLVEVLADRILRDGEGRPRIRYSERYLVLKLVPEDPAEGWPCFNVANIDRHPEYLDAWIEHRQTEKPFHLTA